MENLNIVNSFFILNKRYELIEEFSNLKNEEDKNIIISIIKLNQKNTHLKTNENINTLKDFISIYSKLLNKNKPNNNSKNKNRF